MIVVTGSSGFIGEAIVRSFGDESIGLQRRTIQQSNILECDLTNRPNVEMVIKKLQGKPITHFIHAAATTPWAKEVDFSKDLVMAQSVKEICDSLTISNLILMSGWNVYDMTGVAPFSEETEIDPMGEYGASKYALEEFFRNNMADKNVLNLRLASVYGQGQLSSGLIPNLVSSALVNESMTLQSIQTKRDYLYVDDLIAVLHYLVTSGNIFSDELNIGSGKSVAVIEIAEAIKRILKVKHGIDVDINVPDVPQESMPFDNKLDITKAKRRGLLTQITPIETGLENYITWRINENIL